LNQVEPFFAGMGKRDAVLLGFQAFLQGPSELVLVFDHENSHWFPFSLYGSRGLRCTDDFLKSL